MTERTGMTGAETVGSGRGIFPVGGGINPTWHDDIARNEDAFARARRGRRAFDSYSSTYYASWNDKTYEHTLHKFPPARRHTTPSRPRRKAADSPPQKRGEGVKHDQKSPLRLFASRLCSPTFLTPPPHAPPYVEPAERRVNASSPRSSRRKRRGSPGVAKSGLSFSLFPGSPVSKSDFFLARRPRFARVVATGRLSRVADRHHAW